MFDFDFLSGEIYNDLKKNVITLIQKDKMIFCAVHMYKQLLIAFWEKTAITYFNNDPEIFFPEGVGFRVAPILIFAQVIIYEFNMVLPEKYVHV